MTDKTLNMEMANLICRFGDQKVLLDFFDEMVYPSFFDEKLVRSYSKTSFFFHKVSLLSFGSDADGPNLGIVGRFIKDTTLEREQIFKRSEGLIKDSESMRSSPSSLFLLLLKNHRLIYIKETKNAPSKESFRSTLLAFLREKREQYITSLYEESKNKESLNSPKVTKGDLQEKISRPSVEIIPLTSEQSIEKFIKKYNVLSLIEISFSDRNDESDNDPFFEELQKRKDALGSEKSIVRHKNSKGLDKEKVITEISEATAQGNQLIKLDGKDKSGDILRGNNEEFQLRKPIKGLSAKPKKAGNQLYEAFSGLVKSGLVKIPKAGKETKRKLDKIMEKYLNGN